MDDTILRGLAAWEYPSQSLHTLTEINHDRLVQSLRFSHSRAEAIKRLLANDVLNALPPSIYWLITSLLKKSRSGGVVAPTINPIIGPLMQLQQAISPFYLVITHDIDTETCYRLWPTAIDIETQYGIRSASNVLTAGPYTLDQGWLTELDARGFELGLHGDSHDMAIGFRDMSKARGRLQRCLDVLGRPIMGYRAPAYGVSEALLSVLETLGFRYDSSIKGNGYYQDGIDNHIPYLYPSTTLWELPLTVGDDALFRNQHLDDDQAVNTLQAITQAMQAVGAVMVFNTHPIYMEAHPRFYRDFLAWVHDQAIEVVLARDLITRLDSNLAALSPETA